MAGRQLQRLLKQQMPAGDGIIAGETQSSSSSEDEDEGGAQPAFNPFDLLSDEDDNEVGFFSITLR